MLVLLCTKTALLIGLFSTKNGQIPRLMHTTVNDNPCTYKVHIFWIFEMNLFEIPLCADTAKQKIPSHKSIVPRMCCSNAFGLDTDLAKQTFFFNYQQYLQQFRKILLSSSISCLITSGIASKA